MKVNIALTPLGNVLAAINAANAASSTNITESQVTAGAPVAAGGTGGRNTTVLLTGIDGQGIEGTRTFSYTRQALDGGAVATTAPTFVIVLQADTREQSLAKVVAALGLKASEVESLSYTAPIDQATAGTIQLGAINPGYLYIGTRDVELRFADADVPFAEIAPVTDADGFDAEE